MARALYYDPARPSAFTTLRRLVQFQRQKSARGRKPGDIEAWFLKQGAYVMHRPVRKCFPRNSYSVTNVMDVWECDWWMFRLSVNITITTNICNIYTFQRDTQCSSTDCLLMLRCQLYIFRPVTVHLQELLFRCCMCRLWYDL